MQRYYFAVYGNKEREVTKKRKVFFVTKRLSLYYNARIKKNYDIIHLGVLVFRIDEITVYGL